MVLTILNGTFVFIAWELTDLYWHYRMYFIFKCNCPKELSQDAVGFRFLDLDFRAMSVSKYFCTQYTQSIKTCSTMSLSCLKCLDCFPLLPPMGGNIDLDTSQHSSALTHCSCLQSYLLVPVQSIAEFLSFKT